MDNMIKTVPKLELLAYHRRKVKSRPNNIARMASELHLTRPRTGGGA